ncbi:MAG: type 1 periplasmic binding fold superfamily protein [Flavobacteriales bacterium]|nr:type 1 periplasmic binding fold superfamily protein [Flavobacteriales bacterium]
MPFVMGVLAIGFFTACENDDEEDPVIPNEEEVITTVQFNLVPSGGGDTITWSFTDLDGDGGNDPVIVNGAPLLAGTTYNSDIQFLNELEDPADDITEEVEDEADEHQIFYLANGADIDISYTDMDGDGNPLGLATAIVAQSASTGTLDIVLRHEPDKDAAGVSEGDISNAGGETDIEVQFEVDIQ